MTTLTNGIINGILISAILWVVIFWIAIELTT